jgi:hypothetical protein
MVSTAIIVPKHHDDVDEGWGSRRIFVSSSWHFFKAFFITAQLTITVVWALGILYFFCNAYSIPVTSGKLILIFHTFQAFFFTTFVYYFIFKFFSGTLELGREARTSKKSYKRSVNHDGHCTIKDSLCC